ncbi:hypothetical protein B0T20DRAFT_45587 [Sordaria brevicollis]|uniref:Uncharacterized protein n=1 Tax=Sordaria brevicollis TaxID=83679 RepID=A0AAE0P9G8_SORBR|nr:hypothetical protein B0T20DRAFT_45587 [Sordaria brevicollis]
MLEMLNDTRKRHFTIQNKEILMAAVIGGGGCVARFEGMYWEFYPFESSTTRAWLLLFHCHAEGEGCLIPIPSLPFPPRVSTREQRGHLHPHQLTRDPMILKARTGEPSPPKLRPMFHPHPSRYVNLDSARRRESWLLPTRRTKPCGLAKEMTRRDRPCHHTHPHRQDTLMASVSTRTPPPLTPHHSGRLQKAAVPDSMWGSFGNSCCLSRPSRGM